MSFSAKVSPYGPVASRGVADCSDGLCSIITPPEVPRRRVDDCFAGAYEGIQPLPLKAAAVSTASGPRSLVSMMPTTCSGRAARNNLGSLPKKVTFANKKSHNLESGLGSLVLLYNELNN